MNNAFFLGCSCYREFDIASMNNAGITWIRTGMPWPYLPDGNTISDSFKKFARRCVSLSENGFRLCVSTPVPRRIKLDAEPGSIDTLAALNRRACNCAARETGNAVSIWQVSNESNLPYFREPLNTDAIVRFMQAGARGIKEYNPHASIGINMASGDEPLGYEIIEKTYSLSPVEFDYAGIDGYFGSWEPGEPETWSEKLDILYKKFHMPVIIQEFGHPSAGSVMTRGQLNSGVGIMELSHGLKKWPHKWEQGFSPKSQAQYLKNCVGIFKSKPFVSGAFWFRWADTPECWYCHTSDCPCETAWGLVTKEGKPKPAHSAFRETAATAAVR